MAIGGARPGAGRKSYKTQELQRVKRGLMEDTFDPETWRKVCERGRDFLLNGSTRDFGVIFPQIAPYLIGARPTEDITVHHEGQLAIVQWPAGWEPPLLDEPHTIDHEPDTLLLPGDDTV